VSDDSPRVAVIVVAAGSGVRLGQNIPKAFVEIGEVSLLERAVRTIADVEHVRQVIVVAPVGREDQARHITERALESAEYSVTIVTGGVTRHESVIAGLTALESSIDIVVVHDAARCLAPDDVFDRVIARVRETGNGVVPGLAVSDALKWVDNNTVTGPVDRTKLLAVQTPQGFPRNNLDKAYATTAKIDHNDDAAVFDLAGFTVETCAGDDRSFKITTAADLARASRLVAGIDGSRVRMGTATDTHAFGEPRGLRLAGLDWPEEHVLSGHSDGDAVAHAIVDALLVAAGLGDIGGMVGIDDPAYAGASGDVFVREAVRRLAEAGYRPVNVTAQIVGNRPRFSSRRSEAEHVLSGWVGAPVTLSATTTDGLGFTGEGRGISVIATALISHKA